MSKQMQKEFDVSVRIEQIKKELFAIEEGFYDMLNGNETIHDRLLALAYELITIIEKL
jgi:hypothetical protein